MEMDKDTDMKMEMDKGIDMDEQLTNPAKIRILGQVKLLHGLEHRHPRGIFTAPFSCQVDKILITDGMLLLLGLPIVKASVPSSFAPVKTYSESEKSRFKKILEKHSCVGMADPISADVPVQTSLESYNYSSSTSPMAMLDNDVVMRRYENFKKFDIVVDHSDHLFAAHCSEKQQPDWINMIRNEWKILEEHLPDTIFVRAYESRMDLLRAAIIGLEGTPYQDGLFVFDVFFPQNYPNSPPLVRYHSCGLSGINPVINNHTGVGLNLFTADGKREMLWAPNTSVLQLLVLIQNLILNAKPFFNGFIASFRNSVYGEWSSLLYNENTIIKSLKTMVYTMNNPPKNFEDLVVGHFCKHARDILMGCKAYMEGLLVGCLVTDEYEPCSMEFKNDVASCINPLIDAFKKIGAKEAQEFHYLAKKRKAVVEEDINDAVNRKRKDTVSDDLLPWNIFADRDCVVTKVLIKCPTWVKKGQPLYSYDVTKLEKVIIPKSTKIASSAYNKVVMVNHKSRVGIFSMEDVLVGQEFAQTQTIPMVRPSNEIVMKRYGNFKKFESVMDCSDHFFSEQSSEMKQPPSSWANKIREEWRILEESLPDTIFVRVYESRMDLLRAVIIGPEGTPYHGGLFFFDVCFPSDYPNSPPLVHYHSGGLAINPNLSKCGEVRLSLPRKCGGQLNMWMPGRSTVLQLLVSMQKWIFNAHPLFNDLTYAIISDTSYGHQCSFRYNENIRIKSLKTMLYIMNKPPKNFEDFVPGYFCKRARDILTMACEQNPYSVTYEKDLYLFFQPLVTAFWNMGADKMQISFSKKK